MHIIMHETCHFLYFKKWGELYPKISKKKYEYPYVEWHLSELVAPIILNDHRVQKILKGKTEFYPEHKRIKINGKSAPKYFTDLYNKFSKENDFEGFVRESYKEINKHKKLFKF
ncbi:MAG: hypothetical protein ACM3KM_00360 [Acidobacteriaceae bacterium]